MAREERTQVVVVGAGPVGLLLAGELRLGGAEVIVLEALASPATESRASTLHARTMEILDSRGLVPALGGPPSDPRGHFGGLPLDLTLPTSHPGQWKVVQADTERVLTEWAGGLGADIRRGHTVRGLKIAADHVEVRAGKLRVRADYVVGCDGEHSTVRRLAGLEFAGQPASLEMIRADVAGIDVPTRRFVRLPKGLVTSGKLPNGVTRVMVHEFGTPPSGRTAPVEFAELVAVWRRVTGEDISHGEPLWLNAFDDTSGQVTRYRDGRVLLAGDAAHRQLPVGGQALNLGLQDAFNLGWKLAAVATGRVPQRLLDTYHDERHAIGARTLTAIRAQAQLLFGGPEVEPLRAVVGELMAYDDVREHLARLITGLDAANRLPFGVRGQLLVSTQDSDLGRLAARWSGRVDVVPAEVTAPVRPDGETAWRQGDDTSLSEALTRWFGPPHTLAAAPRRHSRLLGVGGYRPRRTVGNDEICRLVETSEEWIRTRSGIVARGFADPDETLPMMGERAAAEALKHAGVAAGQIDHVIVATSSNKVHMPALASAVAEAVGAHGASGFDLNAACSGFTHALAAASDAVCAGQAEHVLVVGVERMRDIVDPHDRGTSFLFADGAGAVVVGASEQPGIGPVVRGSSPGSLDAVRMSELWDGSPVFPSTLRMDGKRVFRWSMTDVLPAARRAIEAAGLSPADIAAFVPHQANARMIAVMARELGLRPDAAVGLDVRDAGNTSAASIPLALHRLIEEGAVAAGAPALLLGFGSGLGYCGQVVLVP